MPTAGCSVGVFGRRWRGGKPLLAGLAVAAAGGRRLNLSPASATGNAAFPVATGGRLLEPEDSQGGYNPYPRSKAQSAVQVINRTWPATGEPADVHLRAARQRFLFDLAQQLPISIYL